MYLKPYYAWLPMLLIFLVVSVAPVASQECPSKTVRETQIIRYVPPLPSEKREGYCWTNSNVLPRRDAWRCMVGNEIYDPCYTVGAKGEIVCDARPEVDGASGFVLGLNKPLPIPDGPSRPSPSAAMIELEDGILCDFISGASGATDGVRSERISYSCRSKGRETVIFGELRPGTVWMAEKGILAEQKTRDDLPPLMVKDLRTVRIKTVWQ